MDSWGLYNRECTSFVANRLSKVNKFTIPRAFGNGSDWANNARSKGFVVNNVPKRGSVAQWSSNYGHVAWVAAVNGNKVTIEEYNTPAGSGRYNVREIDKSSASSYIHFKYLEISIPSGKTKTRTEGSTVIITSTFTGSVEQLAAIKKVEYPTWSHNNVANKVWHTAKKINNTTYEARVDLSTYKQYGLYSTHSYITNTDGYQKNFAANNGYKLNPLCFQQAQQQLF